MQLVQLSPLIHSCSHNTSCFLPLTDHLKISNHPVRPLSIVLFLYFVCFIDSRPLASHSTTTTAYSIKLKIISFSFRFLFALQISSFDLIVIMSLGHLLHSCIPQANFFLNQYANHVGILLPSGWYLESIKIKLKCTFIREFLCWVKSQVTQMRGERGKKDVTSRVL